MNNPATHYVVYRLLPTSKVAQPISRAFATHEQARRYVESLPTDWRVEIRELGPEAA